MKTKFNNQFHGYQDELIALQEATDSVNWALTRKDEELKALDLRIKGLSDRYKEEKEVSTAIVSLLHPDTNNYNSTLASVSAPQPRKLKTMSGN